MYETQALQSMDDMRWDVLGADLFYTLGQVHTCPKIVAKDEGDWGGRGL